MIIKLIKNLVLDKINEEVSTSNDDSFYKKGWKRINKKT